MLSILIPTYNLDCTALVKALAAQASELQLRYRGDFDYEIIVADDCSTLAEAVEGLQHIRDVAHCQLVTMPENRGSALVRNRLIELAHFDYILFIDADAAMCAPHFLETYWTNRHKADVICGSLENVAPPCPPGKELRFKYEMKAYHKRQKMRAKRDPYFHLSTFNLWIRKAALGTLRFDARCLQYGYEDALLGLQLKARGISLIALDNPLIHTGIDTNEQFLRKTETAMRTLSRLDGLMKESAGTSRAYAKLRRWHLAAPFCCCFQCVKPLIRYNLLGKHPNLFLFHVYKLGFYTSIQPH